MPKIFEYLGIVIFFYAHEHEPVHVHARYEGRENKAEFIIENGKITIKVVGNSKSLKSSELKKFDDFLEVYTPKELLKNG